MSPLVRVLMLLSVSLFLLPAGISHATLDGRTDAYVIGDREDGSQVVRVRYTGDDGRCLRVATAGIRTRNAAPAPPTADGTIVLPPGPAAGNIVWAGLYWTILANTPPVNNVKLNGVPVTPVALPVTGSPCWPQRYAYPYFADVTTLVATGANAVVGLDDSGQLAVAPESEGASLVVIYVGEGTGACEIIVMDGNDRLYMTGQQIDNFVPVSCGDNLPARLTFIGADGQTGVFGPAPDRQIWNGVSLGGNDPWNASDSGAANALVNLSWDTDSWDVTTGGGNTASINIPFLGGPGDCVNWIATVIEVNVQACLPPPATGACCLPDGTCMIATLAECEAAGGTYQGDDTVCEPNPCPPPPPVTGACCRLDGSCYVTTQLDCEALGHQYQGDNVPCEPNPCPTAPHMGACCRPDGSCYVATQAACEEAGNIYQGDLTECQPNPCPPVGSESATWGEIKTRYR